MFILVLTHDPLADSLSHDMISQHSSHDTIYSSFAYSCLLMLTHYAYLCLLMLSHILLAERLTHAFLLSHVLLLFVYKDGWPFSSPDLLSQDSPSVSALQSLVTGSCDTPSSPLCPLWSPDSPTRPCTLVTYPSVVVVVRLPWSRDSGHIISAIDLID